MDDSNVFGIIDGEKIVTTKLHRYEHALEIIGMILQHINNYKHDDFSWVQGILMMVSVTLYHDFSHLMLPVEITIDEQKELRLLFDKIFAILDKEK